MSSLYVRAHWSNNLSPGPPPAQPPPLWALAHGNVPIITFVGTPPLPQVWTSAGPVQRNDYRVWVPLVTSQELELAGWASGPGFAGPPPPAWPASSGVPANTFDEGYPNNAVGFTTTRVRLFQDGVPGTDHTYTVFAPNGQQIGTLSAPGPGWTPYLAVPAALTDTHGIWSVEINRTATSSVAAPGIFPNGSGPANGVNEPYVSPYGDEYEGILGMEFEGTPIEPPVVCRNDVILSAPSALPCAQSGGTVQVTFTAAVVPAVPAYIGDYRWRVTQGNTIIQPFTAGSNSFQIDLAPGNYKVSVKVKQPSCPDGDLVDGDTFTIPVCLPPCDLQITAITTAIGNCNANADRQVIATPHVSNPSPGDEYWWTIDGSAATMPVPAGPLTFYLSAAGPGQTMHTIGLAVRRGGSCLATALPVNVLLDPCGPGPNCPTITFISTAPGPCTSDRTGRQMQVDAILAGPAATSYTWTFGDGTSETRPASSLPATTHTYTAPGTYTVTFTASGPGGCSVTDKKELTVDACCPEATAITVTLGTCIPGTAGSTDMQPVTLAAQTRGSGIAGYSWDFGDGTTLPPPSQASPPPHDYSAPGTYTATVTVIATDPTCPPTMASTTLTVAACTTPPPPPPTMGGGCLCVLLLVLAMSLIALSSAGIFAWACGGFLNVILLSAASTMFLLGLFLLILWAFLCGRFICPALVLLVNVFASLAAALGVLALVLFLLGLVTCAIGALIIGGLFAAISIALIGAGKSVGCIP